MLFQHPDYLNIAGEYGQSESLSLTLNNMPSGDSITVSFDLLLFGTWDGHTNNNGPDKFLLDCNGFNLMQSTFSNPLTLLFLFLLAPAF